jgi:site-specific DNA-methyltransferase (adenine-specific)
MKDIEKFKNKIICGDCLEVLKEIPDNSIDCIITIVNVALECIRVLKKTGVFFLNLGDVFYTPTHQGEFDRLNKEFNKIYEHRVYTRGKYKDNWLQQKGRLLLPFRVAIALQERKIIIRDVIIWAKKITKYPERTSIGTTMPFPVRDRLLPAFEYIFQIVKSKKYYFDLSQIKTQIKQSSLLRYQNPILETYRENNPHKKTMAGIEKFRKKYTIAYEGKDWNVKIKNELKEANPTNVLMFKVENQRSVPPGHYAKFPTSLAEFFILSGCPQNGIVLDPFCGSGTTCVVAKKLGRNYIGIDISKKYCEIAEKRLEKTQSPLIL